MPKTILVTGATGRVASAAVAELKRSGHVVHALVRHPEKAEPLRAMGAQIVIGDLEKPKSLPHAVAGADSIFIVTPAGPRAPEHSSNVLWAAREAGVRHVVRLSAFGAAHDAPTINGRLHALSDSELLASGIAYTILKPHFFMENLLQMSAGTIKSDGAFYLPLGESRMAMIDVRDIAEFAARTLTSSEHENKTYTLTGPASISMNEAASALGEALGKRVNYMPVPLDAALDTMAKMGVDEWTLTLLGDYFAAFSRNWGDKVTDDFPRVMGRPARSITDFARDFAFEFG